MPYYRALVTGTHAITGYYIEAGKIYNLESEQAGPEVFEPAGDEETGKELG